MTDHKHDKVRSRNEQFAEKVSTKISCEIPSQENPYIAQSVLCYGYDIAELMQSSSFVDVFYLLFRGELPSSQDTRLLEALMIALMNPGPRHPATRAAMNVGVGKSNTAHILPIASALMGGTYQGGGEIEDIMRFIRKNQKYSVDVCIAKQLSGKTKDSDGEGSDSEGSGTSPCIPGFGQMYGGIDHFAQSLAIKLEEAASEEHSALAWGMQMANALGKYEQGWLIPGLAAAVLSDLGFHPRAGTAVFQLMSAPGLLAHGLELANKPITAMPYVSDENYVIESK